MDIPCPNPPVLCVNPDEAVLNASAEDVDEITYVRRTRGFVAWPWGLGGGWGIPLDGLPALGQPNIDGGGDGIVEPQFCEDTDPLNAELCANTIVFDLQNQLNNNTPAPEVFPNTEQICTISGYSYTTPAGLFHASTLAAANEEALNYACSRVTNTLLPQNLKFTLKLSDLSQTWGCKDELYTGNIRGISRNPPYQFDTVGAVPAWMSLSVTPTRVIITGTPDTVGAYGFTIRATDAVGRVAERTYELDVIGIEDAVIPRAVPGGDYSFTFTAEGPTNPPVTWVALDVPDWLTMNADTGELSGTAPIDLDPDEDIPIIVAVSDDRGDEVSLCSKDFTIEVGCSIPEVGTPFVATDTSALACPGVGFLVMGRNDSLTVYDSDAAYALTDSTTIPGENICGLAYDPSVDEYVVLTRTTFGSPVKIYSLTLTGSGSIGVLTLQVTQVLVSGLPTAAIGQPAVDSVRSLVYFAPSIQEVYSYSTTSHTVIGVVSPPAPIGTLSFRFGVPNQSIKCASVSVDEINGHVYIPLGSLDTGVVADHTPTLAILEYDGSGFNLVNTFNLPTVVGTENRFVYGVAYDPDSSSMIAFCEYPLPGPNTELLAIQLAASGGGVLQSISVTSGNGPAWDGTACWSLTDGRLFCRYLGADLSEYATAICIGTGDILWTLVGEANQRFASIPFDEFSQEVIMPTNTTSVNRIT